VYTVDKRLLNRYTMDMLYLVGPRFNRAIKDRENVLIVLGKALFI